MKWNTCVNIQGKRTASGDWIDFRMPLDDDWIEERMLIFVQPNADEAHIRQDVSPFSVYGMTRFFFFRKTC